MTLIITCRSAKEAHEMIISKIMNPNYSNERLTEMGEITREITDVRIKIVNGITSERFSDKCFMKIKGFQEYARCLIHGYKDNVEFDYDYNERLRHWGKNKIKLYDDEIEIDQINYIIHKLQKEPDSRRAVAITWIPPHDETITEVPCLQFIQCIIENGKLNMFVLFRSEDMLSAFGQNVYGLMELQKYIAEAIDVPVGDYYHYVVSAHIYYIRDAFELERFMKV